MRQLLLLGMALLCALSPLAVASTSSTAGASTDLSVTLGASAGPVRPGQLVVYTLVATNGGALAVAGARVQDTVATLTNVTWTCAATAGSSCVTGGSGSVDQSVDLAAGGTVTFSITGTFPLDPGGIEFLPNAAMITAPAGIVDTNPANNIASITSLIDVEVLLKITNTATQATYVRGGTIDYIIVITNEGPDLADGVTLKVDVPSNTTFVSITPPPGFDCGTQPIFGQITCGAMASLPISSNTFLLRVSVATAASGPISDSAEVSYGPFFRLSATAVVVPTAVATVDTPAGSLRLWILLGLALLSGGALAARRQR